MTTVYFLRHGQSIGNKEHLFLGHTDMDLSELGYKQAELASKFLSLLKIDVIYSSDLTRTYNTVKPTADKLGLPIHKSEKLREIYAGDWEGKSIDELWTTYVDTFSVWKNDIGNSIVPNGESIKELFDRIDREVERIVSENRGKSILIATHATPIRVMNCKWKNMTLSQLQNIPWVTNASLTSVCYNDDGTYDIKTNSFDGYLKEFTSGLPKRI